MAEEDYRAGSGEWKELNNSVNSAIEQLLEEQDSLSQVLTTHRELLAADPSAPKDREDSSTEKFMDFLLQVDPNLDLRALIVDETQVNASLGGKQFSGIYNFESLTRKLVNDDFVESSSEYVDRNIFGADYDNFVRSARRYKSVTEEFFDGEAWEIPDIELQIQDRVVYEEELRSEDPRRIVPALAGYQPEVHARLGASLPGSRDTTNPYVRETIQEFTNPTREASVRTGGRRATLSPEARRRLQNLGVSPDPLPTLEGPPGAPPSEVQGSSGVFAPRDFEFPEQPGVFAPRDTEFPEPPGVFAPRDFEFPERPGVFAPRDFDFEAVRQAEAAAAAQVRRDAIARVRERFEADQAAAAAAREADARRQARSTGRFGDVRSTDDTSLPSSPRSPADIALEEKIKAAQTDEKAALFQQLLPLVGAETAFQLAYGSSDTGGDTGSPGRPSLAQVQAADRAEVEEFLRTQFGGFEFFLDKHASKLQVGLTADGLIVAADDPSAVTAKNVLDVIVEQGLTDPGRIEGALSNTQWWKDTDAQARVFDVTYANLNDLERLEYVEPTMDLIREELQFLGAEMSDVERQDLAADLMRLGDEADTETVRDMLIQRLGETFDPGAQSISDFAAARDEIEALSRKYFVPIDTVAAGEFAEEIYLGQRSATEMEQYFKEHALSKFPTLDNAIKNGFTPEEYFAPYKYEIEKMLGRPNISLYDEFADVIEYFPDTGGNTPRPMTMHEVRKYVRGLPEWQQSDAGRASAEALAFAIGKTFGEVA